MQYYKVVIILLSFFSSSVLYDCVGQDTYRAEVLEFQEELTNTYSDEDKSILNDENRIRFIELGGHPFFDVDPSFRVEAKLQVFSNPEKVGFETSTTRIADYVKYGEATFILNGIEQKLTIFQSAKIMVGYEDYLFLPFTDLNSGGLSYGGGRYMDLKIPQDSSMIVLDFNKSYHPYCAYTTGYSCPIPPPENFIDTHIDAGIKLKNFDQLSSVDLLNKSIAFHDPENNWNKLNATLDFETVMADSSTRTRTINIDNKNREFKFSNDYKEETLEYAVKNNIGKALWNGKSKVPEDMAKQYRITNDRAIMYRNYYTYLYGMPMKLRDPGTQIDSTVSRVRFYGEIYDRIRVTYDPKVGKDIWYFYFDTETHALEAYQFFKDETKNDGEYILFEELKNIDGIKIPRIRHWYYNNDQKFLATDILKE